MPARLVPLTPGAAPPIALERPVILIGRHPECDAHLDFPQISRRHCCVAQVAEAYILRDLGSRNGVHVNGQKIDEARLKPGDEVAIAQFLYRLDAPDPRPAAPATPAAAKTPAPSPAPAAPQASPAPPKPAPKAEVLPLASDPDNDLVPLSEIFPDL
jgi:predicted component of type VI protein secretion system